MRKINLTAEKEAELREFWPGIQPLRVLSERWGCSDVWISKAAKYLGLPSRKGRLREIIQNTHKERFDYAVKNCNYLVEEARRRGMTLEQLRRALIQTIANDRMVDAILDDSEELPPKHEAHTA